MAAIVVAGSLGSSAWAAPVSGFWKLTAKAEAAPPRLKNASVARVPLGTVAARPADLAWCVVQGLPYVMKDAGPIDIINGPSEVLMSAERLALQRHIYLDRSTHPDPADFDATPVGNSYGAWSGNTLTIYTTGFADGVGPAGVPRTAQAHLVEVARLKGDVLTVDSTWTDPSVLAQPYRYTLTYSRLPADYQPQEYWCDPRNNGVAKK